MLRATGAWTMTKKTDSDILDELLKGCDRPEDLLGESPFRID